MNEIQFAVRLSDQVLVHITETEGVRKQVQLQVGDKTFAGKRITDGETDLFAFCTDPENQEPTWVVKMSPRFMKKTSASVMSSNKVGEWGDWSDDEPEVALDEEAQMAVAAFQSPFLTCVTEKEADMTALTLETTEETLALAFQNEVDACSAYHFFNKDDVLRPLCNQNKEDNHPWLALIPYIPGRNLDDYILSFIKTEAELLNLLLEVVTEVQTFHTRLKRMHGDLALSNIRVKPDGQVVLFDFDETRSFGVPLDIVKKTGDQSSDRRIASELLQPGIKANVAIDIYRLGEIIDTAFLLFSREKEHVLREISTNCQLPAEQRSDLNVILQAISEKIAEKTLENIITEIEELSMSNNTEKEDQDERSDSQSSQLETPLFRPISPKGDYARFFGWRLASEKNEAKESEREVPLAIERITP